MPDTYIVAEIGTAHGGDLERAEDLIAAAAAAGADCAKFQYVIADEIVHPTTGLVELPGGPVPLHARFREVEREPDFYARLQSICGRYGIDFLCTPFGTASLAALTGLGVSRLKVASPEINHTPLLEAVHRTGLPVILSTGVSRLADIEYALSVLDGSPVTILHCVTSYPAPETEVNLRVMASLFRVFGRPVGLSDHSSEPVLVPGLAAALGAVMIEKHFTLDHSGGGLDDLIAMDPDQFGEMCAAIRRIDAVRSLDPAHGGERVIDEFRAEFGDSRVSDVLGDGIKRLAPSEAGDYTTTRRSVHAVNDVAAGDTLSAQSLAVLRSENLEPGIDPRFLSRVIGAAATRPLRAGQGLQWKHVIHRPGDP